jgi:hypothetical protein
MVCDSGAEVFNGRVDVVYDGGTKMLVPSFNGGEDSF